MKHILILTGLIVIMSTAFSQEETLSRKELKQLAKEEKRARQQEEDQQKKEITALMLEYHKFVLEADYVGNKTGERQPVSSNINFIVIDSLEATIQLGTPYRVGNNGVGGVTVDGRVTKYELREIQRKNSKTYTLIIIVMTSVGTYDITFQISETGYTDATIRGNTSGQLQYSGKLVPIGVSKVYKGTTIF